MRWLLWCFERQRWSPRELVIIDSSPEPLQIAERDDVRVVTAPAGTMVARKRNLALQEARGDIVTWFDDWQHPHKLSCLSAFMKISVGPAIRVGYGNWRRRIVMQR
jgi:hypothetical protein